MSFRMKPVENLFFVSFFFWSLLHSTVRLTYLYQICHFSQYNQRLARFSSITMFRPTFASDMTISLKPLLLQFFYDECKATSIAAAPISGLSIECYVTSPTQYFRLHYREIVFIVFAVGQLKEL